MLTPLDPAHLPQRVRSRFVPDVNGLTMHVLDAGFESADRPCVLLLHGFPELAYSWRRCDAGARRGRLPRDRTRPARLRPHHRRRRRLRRRPGARSACLNLVRDALGLLAALGVRTVHAVVGPRLRLAVAAWSALTRPDVFRSVVLMSAPFGGATGTARERAATGRVPTPRSTTARRAAAPAQALPALLHDARGKRRHVAAARKACMLSCAPTTTTRARTGTPTSRIGSPSWSADEMAKMPTYYVMDRTRHGADGGARDAGRCGDRKLPLASRRSAARLQRRVRTQRLSGRAAVVPRDGRCK